MSQFQRSYNPNRSAEWNYGGAKWKLSRSKIDLFIECPRCFYIDNKLGTKRPGFPSFNLNIAVDELFKKEFDAYRLKAKPHPLMIKYEIKAIPFSHEQLNIWRDNFSGIEFTDPETNLKISGAIDDIWKDENGDLIVVDYKATSKEGRIEKLGDSPWEIQYTRQLGVYKWLLEQNGFTVSEIGYLVYANASKDMDDFADRLSFETTLVEVKTDTSWIEETLKQIKTTLESSEIPKKGEACEFCPYRETAGKKLQAIHFQNKAK